MAAPIVALASAGWFDGVVVPDWLLYFLFVVFFVACLRAFFNTFK